MLECGLTNNKDKRMGVEIRKNIRECLIKQEVW